MQKLLICPICGNESKSNNHQVVYRCEKCTRIVRTIPIHKKIKKGKSKDKNHD